MPRALTRARRQRLGGDELDRPLERAEGRLGSAALVEEAAEPVVEACRPHCIAGRRPVRWLAARAPRRAAPRRSGWRARPPTWRARRGRSARAPMRPARRPTARARARDAERLCEAEDGLRLARGLHRGEERVCFATCRRPMGRQLRGSRRAATRELVGDPGMELLALAGQHRRVDGLCEQRVTKAEAAPRRLGNENAVLHRPAQGLAQVALGQLRDLTEERVTNVASGGGGQPQDTLGRVVEAADALEEEVAQFTGELSALLAGRGEELLGEEGVALRAGHDRVGEGGRERPSGAPREVPSTRHVRAVRARARASSRSAGHRPRASACARQTLARPRGRSRAAEPAGRRRCARGRRGGRVMTCRPSGDPRARAAPARWLPGR